MGFAQGSMIMNKRMIVLIALVVAVFAVPASAETLEVRGNVVNLYGAQPSDLVWDATNFGAFWYDLDDDLMTEELTILANTLDGTMGTQDREIDENALIYTTHPELQTYELYENEGLIVEGDSPDLEIGYYLEGWMAEKYVAVNGNADKLAKLLVEFEDDDKKTLSTGESWALGGGFTLTANRIDPEGEKVWLSLAKDGKELDNEVVSTGAATPDKNDSVYTYTVDLAGEDDVPLMSCLVDAVFRGTDTNVVQLMYVFLADDEVIEIDTSDTYGIMEVMTASLSQIVLMNDESTLDLDTGRTEHIMGDMYFKTADNDGAGEDGALRFYPYVECTEPGTYEVRGNVVSLSMLQVADIEWNATTFAAFWYDIDDNLMTEDLTILANTLDGTIGTQDREIDENALIYTTHPAYQAYELYENEGMVVEGGSTELESGYYLEGWMAEKYVAVNGNADKLTKLLVEFEDDDKKILYIGKKWNISGGFALELVDIDDVTGDKATLRLSKNGNPLDTTCIDTGGSRQDRVYTYTADIGTEKDIPVFSCYVDAVFKGDVSYVQLMYVFLIDDDVLEIETSDEYGAMEVMTASTSMLVLKNDETTIDLDPGTTEHIMGDMYFKTADDDTAIRFYPFVERTIGGEEPTPPPETIPATDSDHDGVPDVWDADNSTQEGYWVNPQGIGRMPGDMNGDGRLTSVDALMILQATVGKIDL
uniref:Major S-layer protein n=2 Tax=Candidatus Methanogaster sp. ANME-2c ERB4 TaxID=2759911 RepID=A0A7G9Y531_9EURY|nr:major S-layer protein [Methanosarcinales archaeon ANME-2c ERB4]QNO43115.1 major S-layer protein [Methanosarcinales archaeon ANME-2c ERB4]QNO45237.1 major S-layer protein [Methanosarcinales archaeon ANME-2c ERB4]